MATIKVIERDGFVSLDDIILSTGTQDGSLQDIFGLIERLTRQLAAKDEAIYSLKIKVDERGEVNVSLNESVETLQAQLAAKDEALKVAKEFIKEMQLGNYHHAADEVMESLAAIEAGKVGK